MFLAKKTFEFFESLLLVAPAELGLPAVHGEEVAVELLDVVQGDGSRSAAGVRGQEGSIDFHSFVVHGYKEERTISFNFRPDLLKLNRYVGRKIYFSSFDVKKKQVF